MVMKVMVHWAHGFDGCLFDMGEKSYKNIRVIFYEGARASLFGCEYLVGSLRSIRELWLNVYLKSAETAV